MKTVIILETDHLGLAVSDLLNPKEMKLVGMSNSCPETWNVFKDGKNQELKDTINGLPVMPIDLAVSFSRTSWSSLPRTRRKAMPCSTWLSAPDLKMISGS